MLPPWAISICACVLVLAAAIVLDVCNAVAERRRADRVMASYRRWSEQASCRADREWLRAQLAELEREEASRG